MSADEANRNSDASSVRTKPFQQVTYDDSVSSDESDFEFEDVDIDAERDSNQASAPPVAVNDLTLELDAPKVTPSKARNKRRLPSSRIEKGKRLDVHKLHLCCLLTHVYIRNAWCNDIAVQVRLCKIPVERAVRRSNHLQTVLRRLLNRRNLTYLNPDPSHSQFQRSRSFTEGLQQASDNFRIAYKITARGLRRPHWNGLQQGREKVYHSSISIVVTYFPNTFDQFC